MIARLIARRVRDQARLDELFPGWRYHLFITDNTEPVDTADITDRKHAVKETARSDLIDGPMKVMPSGRFAANSACLTCAAICHNLLRSAGTITDDHAVARGATLRRQLVAVPARTARPQGRPVLHLIARWHWQHVRTRLWNAVMPIAADPPAAA